MHTGVQWPTPRLKWPDGKLICCTFRVAYEAFRKSGRFKKSPKIPVNVASLSHANYGGAVGAWRLMDIFERHKIPATIGANGLAVEKWPETIKAFHQAGHEICSHGMTNDHHMTDLSPDEQRQEARACADLIQRCTGVRPVGWVGPGNLVTPETLGVVAEEGYTWFGDAFDDDVPYIAEANGRKIVVIPKLNYANDWRAWSGGLGNGSTYFEGFKTSFDYVYQEALRGTARRDGRDRPLRTRQPSAPRLRLRADDRATRSNIRAKFGSRRGANRRATFWKNLGLNAEPYRPLD